MSTSPSPDLRPLELGEIIDRSAIFWRRHLKPLFLLTFGFSLASYTLSKALQIAMQRTLIQLQAGAGAGSEVLGALLVFMGQWVITLVALMWLLWVSTLVVTRYVVPSWLGETVSLVESFHRALRTLGKFTLAYLLSLLWAVGALLLLLLPAVLLTGGSALLIRQGSSIGSVLGVAVAVGGALLAVLGMFGALLWYSLRFCLLAPALAMEELSAWGAFRRSGQLLSGRVEPGFTGRVSVRAMILVTVVYAIITAVTLVFGVPALVVQAIYIGNPFQANPAALQAIPQHLLVAVELVQLLGQAVFTPLALVFYATFYLDMRMRREGLDLERRLEALEARRTVAS